MDGTQHQKSVENTPSAKCTHCGYFVTSRPAICPNCGEPPLSDRPPEYELVWTVGVIANIVLPIGIPIVFGLIFQSFTGVGVGILFGSLSALVIWFLWYVPLQIRLSSYRNKLSKIKEQSPYLKAVTAKIDDTIRRIEKSRSELSEILSRSSRPTLKLDRVSDYAKRADESLQSLRERYETELIRIKLTQWENQLTGLFARMSTGSATSTVKPDEIEILQRQGAVIENQLSEMATDGAKELLERLHDRLGSLHSVYESLMISKINRAVASVSPIAGEQTANMINTFADQSEFPVSEIEDRVTELEHELDRITAEQDLTS